MPKQYYLPADEGGKADLFDHFSATIGKYLATFDLGPVGGQPNADIAQQAADALYYRWLFAQCDGARGYSQGITAWRDALRDGTQPSTPQAPAPPATPAPPLVPPGIVPRFIALVKKVKTHKNYIEAIGEDLQIEGDEQTGPDLDTLQPEIGAKLAGDEVKITWGWQGFSDYLDQCEIQVDRGDGKGYALLTYDTTPNYNDTYPQPTTPTKWKYKAIYRLDDKRVGLWSKEISITVGG